MSRPWVARVQVTARRPNAELNSSSCAAPVSGWIATVMPLVWPCQESTVEARMSFSVRPCVSRMRSTASVASSTAWLRVARTLTSGSSSSSPGAKRSVLAGRRARVVSPGAQRARTRRRTARRAAARRTSRAAGRRRLPRRRPARRPRAASARRCATCAQTSAASPLSVPSSTVRSPGAATQLSSAHSG